MALMDLFAVIPNLGRRLLQRAPGLRRKDNFFQRSPRKDRLEDTPRPETG
jgi:hypothetical protein